MRNLVILAATGNDEIDKAVEKMTGYEVCEKIFLREDIISACKKNSPDILLLADTLAGREPLPEIIISLRIDHPKLRVVFLTGSIDYNKDDRRSFFDSMVYAGVYDIIHDDHINASMIYNALENPKQKQDVLYLTKKRRSETKGTKFIFDSQEEEEDESKDYYDNLFSISSIKPGTGKSFLSTNVATAIAAFGKKNKDGKPPRVALIEADLQNLSLGTLLQIEDDKYNLKTAMDKICEVVNKDGRLVGDLQQIEDTNKFISACFKPYTFCKNLYALVGSQLTFQQLQDIQSYHYIYLIEQVVSQFDVVIIDTNSALTHITTFPLLKMSKNCFYILNLDFNNVRNNTRYKSFLRDLGVLDKVKYILNEDMPKDLPPAYLGTAYEDLEYNAQMIEKNFELIAKVPMLPKVIFLNHIYDGIPISLDNKPTSLKVRYEIAKVANNIWPVENLEDLREELEKAQTKKREKKWFSRKGK